MDSADRISHVMERWGGVCEYQLEMKSVESLPRT